MRFYKEKWEELKWRTNSSRPYVEIHDASQDSREVQKGWAFFAFDGLHHKGKDFIPQVLEKKPSAIFADVKYQPELTQFEDEAVFFYSSDFQASSRNTIAALFETGAEPMKLVGITGTNGKTTVALLLKNLVERLGVRAMYVGTLGAIIHDETITQTLTTPDVIQLRRLIKKGAETHVSLGFLEVSSHGLDQGRVKGLDFSVGVFTNLSHDHLDYHKTMENYYESKKILFSDMLSSEQKKSFVICTDGPYGRRLFKWLKEQPQEKNILTLSFEGEADLSVLDVSFSISGYTCRFEFQGEIHYLKSQLLGVFNLCNLLCVVSVGYLLGFPMDQMLREVQNLKPIKGRMEPVYNEEGKLVVIDYSHTPDALEKALLALKKLRPNRLSVVFGCGGDRDPGKRPEMGRVVSRFADEAVITNDNPRSEEPMSIAKEIAGGWEDREDSETNARYQIILDRKEAIRKAFASLCEGGILLIAGKGHEEYQIVGQSKKHFSDHETLQRVVHQ